MDDSAVRLQCKTEDDRKGFLTVVVWLTLHTEGRDIDQKAHSILEYVEEKLGLEKGSISTAGEKAVAVTGPEEFPKMIDDPEVRSELVEFLVNFVFRNRIYRASDRVCVRRIAAILEMSDAYFERVEWQAASMIFGVDYCGTPLNDGTFNRILRNHTVIGRTVKLAGAAVAAGFAATRTGGSGALSGDTIGSTAVRSGVAAAVAGWNIRKGFKGRRGAVSEWGLRPFFGDHHLDDDIRESVRRSDPVAHGIICASGFLTQGNTDEVQKRNWDAVGWKWPLAGKNYLEWESQTQKDVYRQIANLVTMAPGFIDAVVNSPWAKARNKADQSGEILGEYLARTELKVPVTLIGHSLGGRLILRALEFLEKKGVSDKVDDVILLNAAYPRDELKESAFGSVVAGRIYNFYDAFDDVLARIYQLREREWPIGRGAAAVEKFVNMDLQEMTDRRVAKRCVKNHYFPEFDELSRALSEVGR